MRVARTVHQLLAGPHALAFVDVHVHAARQRILARLAAIVRNDDHLALTLDDAAVLDDAVDLEMTAGSFGLRASNSSTTRGRPPVMSLVLVVSRDLRQHVAGFHVLAVLHHQVRVRRHVVLPRTLPALSLISIVGCFFSSGRIDDDARQAGDLVHLFVDVCPR